VLYGESLSADACTAELDMISTSLLGRGEKVKSSPGINRCEAPITGDI
jgi:hypothetical protein